MRMEEVVAVREGARGERDLLAVEVHLRIMRAVLDEGPPGEREVRAEEPRRDGLGGRVADVERVRNEQQRTAALEAVRAERQHGPDHDRAPADRP